MAVFTNQPPEDTRPFALQFLRRTEKALAEYSRAREELEDLVPHGAGRWSPYFRALDHLEAAIAQLYRAYDSSRKASGTKLFDSKDNSPLDRLNKIYNTSKHERAINDQPIWITNEGIETSKAKISFTELADLIRSCAIVAGKLANTKMTPKKVYDGTVERLEDLLAQITKSGLADSPHAHLRLWFRGHSEDAWELQPAVYRPKFPSNNQTDRLRIEQHLTQDFQVESAGLRTGRETEAELYFLQQHCRMPTRLLDWTTSPLHALHFAVTESNNCNGEVCMMDAYQLAPKQKTKEFEGIATARSSLFERALRPIFQWHKGDDFPTLILPVRPDQVDRRMSLQRSCFTFHPPTRPILTKAENDSLRVFSIPKAAKGLLKRQLNLLGVDDFTVFGSLESLARRLKSAYKVP